MPVRDFKESKYLKVDGFIVVVFGWNSPTWGKNTVNQLDGENPNPVNIMYLMNNVLELVEVPATQYGDVGRPSVYLHPYKSVFFVGIPSSRNPDVGFGISAGAKKVRARLGTDHRLPCLAVADKKRSASLREATTPQTANTWVEWTQMMGK